MKGHVKLAIIGVFLVAIGLAASVSAPSYNIIGDKIYVDLNGKGYLSATPYLLHGSGNQILELKSYLPTQNLDIALAFDSNYAELMNVWVWANTGHNKYVDDFGFNQHSYTCPTTKFTFNTQTKIATCLTENETAIIYMHGYETGNLQTRTIYWNEWEKYGSHLTTEYYADWKQISVNSQNYNGKTYYWAKNVNIVQNQFYKIKLEINVKPSLISQNVPAVKYDVLFKRSSDTIQEAINSGNYVVIDPWIDAAFSYRKSITWESSAPTYTFYNETHTVMTLAGMTGVTNATKEIAIYRKPCGEETAGDLHSFWRVLGSDATTSPKIMIDGLNVSTGMQWCVYYDCDTCGEPASRSSGMTYDGGSIVASPYYSISINTAGSNEINIAYDLVNDPAKSTDLFGAVTGWICGAAAGAGGWGMNEITTEKTQPVKNETALQTAPRYFFDQTEGSDLFHARGSYVFWRRNIEIYLWGDGNAGDSYCGAGFYDSNAADNIASYYMTETVPAGAITENTAVAWGTAIAVSNNRVYQTRINDSSDKFFGTDPQGSFGFADKYYKQSGYPNLAMKNTSVANAAEKYLGGYAAWFNYENDTAAKDVAIGLVYPPAYTLGTQEEPIDAPTYSNVTATPATPQDYSAARVYKLNATIVDDLDEGGSLSQVILETNYTTALTNYTRASGKVTQGYGDNFQMNWTGAYAGTFVYKWYMSDTQGAWNSTSQATYVVNKITSACTLGLSSTSVTYPTPITAYCTCNNPEVAPVSFTRNGTSITSENNTAVVLGAGGHDYMCNKTVSALGNYTTASDTDIVTVARAAATCTLTSSDIFGTFKFPKYTQPRCTCSNPEATPKLYLNKSIDVLSSWNNSLLVLTEGEYNLECNSTANNYTAATDSDTETIALPITFTSIGNTYETEEARASMTVSTGYLDLDTNAYLFWNSTNKSYNSKNDGGGYDYTFKTNFIVPLIKDNATAIGNFYYINIKLDNGTSYNRNTSAATSTTYYSYWLNGLYDNKGRMIEGDYAKIYLDAGLRNISGARASLSANISFSNSTNTQQANVTNYTVTGSFNRTYSNTFNSYMNNIAQIENRTYFGNLAIRYQNTTRLMNSTAFYYIPAYQMNITNCSVVSSSTYMAMNMFLKTEENLTAIPGTFDYAVKVWHNLETNYRNYSFHDENTINSSFCIYPAWTWLTIDMNAIYSATGYSTRTYYYENNITNATDFLDFYLLENAYSYPSVVFVRDEMNNPAMDYIIKVQRYYAGNDSYRTVLVGKSDSPYGKFSTYLRAYDVFYRFIVEKNGKVITETAPTTIICSPFEAITSCPPYPILLQISTRKLADWFEYYGKIGYSCDVNEATNIFRCTVTDTSGKVSSYNFLVQKKNNLLWDTLCNQNETSPAVTFTCDLGNRTHNLYQYKLSAFMSFPPAILTTGFLDYTIFATGFGFGNMGLIFAMMISGTLFFIGLSNPAVSVALGTLGIIVSYLMGFLPVELGAIIGIGLIAAIIVWRLRS